MYLLTHQIKMASHERSLYNVDSSNDSPEQIHSPDKNARTDRQTDGRLDLFNLKKSSF